MVLSFNVLIGVFRNKTRICRIQSNNLPITSTYPIIVLFLGSCTNISLYRVRQTQVLINDKQSNRIREHAIPVWERHTRNL